MILLFFDITFIFFYSSNYWFKIKKISLIEIQSHLLSDFSSFFLLLIIVNLLLLEIYILGNYNTANKLLLSKENLESLINIKLYTGSNFNDLKEMILTKISNEDSMSLNENFDNSKDIKKKTDDENININKKIDLMDIFYDSLDIGIY